MRVSKLCSALAAALIALAPVHAMAQDDSASVRERSRPEYDPAGRNVGSFTLHASVGLTAESNDNLFAAETNEQDDFVFRVSPNAELRSNWLRHSFNATAGVSLINHADFSSEDANTGYLTAAGRLDIGSSSFLSADAFVSQNVESRSDPDALTNATEPVEYGRSGFSLGASHAFNRVRVTGGVSAVDYDYDDAGAVDQDFRDGSEQSASARVEVAFSERLFGVLSGTADERDYDQAIVPDSDGRTYLAGVRLALTNLMQGELTVGQFDRSYDNGEEIEGTAIAANVEWYATRLTTVTFTADRRAQDTGANTSSPYVFESYAVRVDHELLRNLILTGELESSDYEFQDLDRVDDYMRASAGAVYYVNRRVELNARYEHEENSSDGADAYRDFEINRFLGGVRIRL